MDLRPYLKDKPALLAEGIELIRQRKLWYQPFILADGLEVGEGQNLEERYEFTKSIFDNNVFVGGEFKSLLDGDDRKLAADGKRFAFLNRKYQLCYDRIADEIVRRFDGDISQLSFLEIGCNSGLLLFCLALRGARVCTGIDWTDHGPVVDWLNRVLGTNVQFSRGTYDNVFHSIDDTKVLEHDVVLNTVFVNHQCDPIQFISYLADRAKKALFLWVLVAEQGDDMAVHYGRVSGMHQLGSDDGRGVPLNFHNDVKPTTALLKHILRLLGFQNFIFIEQPTDPDSSPPYALAPFSLVWARRTEQRRSALWAKQYGQAIKSFAIVKEWLDISRWQANNLIVGIASEQAPASAARTVRLTEDSQNNWRNIQSAIDLSARGLIRVSVDIKIENPERQTSIMLLAGSSARVSANFDPYLQRVATNTRDGGIVSGCNVFQLGEGWWRIELAGYLPEQAANEEKFLCIAPTKDGIRREDYQGDGKSSMLVGNVAVSQQTE